MIRFHGQKVTPTQAAKLWLFSNGADSCVNPFDPEVTYCFGMTKREMPTNKEQLAFWKAHRKQEVRVAKFLRIFVEGDTE